MRGERRRNEEIDANRHYGGEEAGNETIKMQMKGIKNRRNREN